MKRPAILIGALAVVAGALAYWGQTTGALQIPGLAAPADPAAGKAAQVAKDGKKGARPPLVVRAVPVEVRPMPVVIDTVGSIESEHIVTVRPQVPGVLRQVLVKDGDRVKPGQVLFRIDSRTFEASIAQAQASVARDEANLALARAQEARLKPLLERDFITRAEYDTAVANLSALQAQVEAGRATLELARIQYDHTYIRAPIAGRIGEITVQAGNFVAPAPAGSIVPPLVTINRTNPVSVNFSLPQQLLETVRRHQGAGLRVVVMREQGGEPIGTGRLTFIDNSVNTATGTITMKATLPNDREQLWPGQFVAVRLVLATEPEAIVVPEIAIQPGQQGPFVYLFQPGEGDAPARARVQPVRIDRQIGDQVVIAAGLKGTERVITEVPPGLAPNAPVRLAEKGAGKGGRKGESRGESAARPDTGPAAAAGHPGGPAAGGERKGPPPAPSPDTGSK
jgi:multidrug efflux system membrane fusion protein